jgi:signal peptidase II
MTERWYRPQIVWPWIVISGLIAIDQMTKHSILFLFSGRFPPVEEVTPFFNLVLVWNRGVSFGFFGSGEARWLLVAFTALVVVILTRWLITSTARWECLGLALIMAGAIGNVIDRIIFGAVIDFLDFHLFGWHFWAFNVADTALTLGVIALLLGSLFPDPKRDTSIL